MMNAKRSSKFNLSRYAFLVPAVVALLLVFSVSKAAFVKVSHRINKATGITTNKGNKINNPIYNNLINANRQIAASPVKKKAVLPSSGKITDTIRSGNVFVSTTENSDSLNYVINGVRSTKAAFKALGAYDIQSVYIATAEEGNRFVDNLDKKHAVLFVATRGSEAGKRFQEKLTASEHIHYSTNTAFSSSNPDKHANNVIVVSGSSKGYGTTFSNSDTDNDVVAITGSGLRNNETTVQAFTTVRHNGPTGPFTVTTRKNSKGKTEKDTIYFGDKGELVFNTDTNIARHNLRPRLYGAGITYNPNSALTFTNQRFSLDHLSDKMIIINGKVASEGDLKKISAFDIDKMVFKNDDETLELYGEKAKNGIVFIVTRKAP